MENPSIRIVTILYHPTSIKVGSYEQLLKQGFGLDIWINSSLNSGLDNHVKYLYSMGANIYSSHVNQGIAIIYNNYFNDEYKDSDFILFLDQDTIIDVTKFVQYIVQNGEFINKNYLTYFYNHKKPDIFFTNSGSLFNLKLGSIVINNFYFVELVDYILLIEILHHNKPYTYERVDFIDHYSQQDNIDEISGRKIYSYTRKKEVTVATLRTIKILLFKKHISFKMKIKMLNHLFKNFIIIIK